MTVRSPALRCALLAGAALCALPRLAAAEDQPPSQTVAGVTVEGKAPSPIDAPLSTQAMGAAEIARTINAVTVEDTLKYLPNILVRRRHPGDTQAPITTRTSGVGASARSLIYADGVLLSALIGNNNGAASPRWGMVSPEEIARIEVRYGPFSAAYPGNSIGAVVQISTRTPDQFEASAKVAAGVQRFAQYATKDDYRTFDTAASLGDRRGPVAWRLSFDRLESRGQPLNYVTVARPAAPSAGTPVTGAFADRNRTGAPIFVLGAGGLERQEVQTAKLKLSWGIATNLTASYLLGWFSNDDEAHVESYLREPAGAPVYSGQLNLGGFAVNVPASAFANAMYRLEERHWMQAATVEGRVSDRLRWQAVATFYDYATDEQRTPSVAPPAAFNGGAGSILDLSGTGWRTLDLKGVWSPERHTVSFGLHEDRYVLGSDRYATADWMRSGRGALAAASHGKTQTEALFVEDALQLAPHLDLTVGVRHERWRAFDGFNYSAAPALSAAQPELSAQRTSPKASLGWRPGEGWQVSASLARAWRFPTVSELYQAVTVGTQLAVPNPNLRPERALASELSVERSWRGGRARLSLFGEDINDALISQTAPVAPGSNTLASFVQNIGRVRSRGAEAQLEWIDVLPRVDVSASITYVDSQIVRDPVFPAAVGKQTPQVPKLRWTAVASWRATDRLTVTGAARYSDRVWATLDNSDLIGHTSQGFEGYLVVDLRAVWKVDRHWTAAVGVDNALDRDYFLFHPFPQRSVLAELKYAY